MGQLFWKYLFAFWLAALAIQFAVDATSRLMRGYQEVPSLNSETEVLRTKVSLCSEFLAKGDVGAVRLLLTKWQTSEDHPEVLVVDASGRELLDRPLAAEDLQFAQKPDRQDAPFSQLVNAPDGQHYSIFVREHEAGRIMYRTRIQLSWKYPFFATIAISFFFSAFLAWYWAAPLRNLRWALHNVAQGNLKTRVMPMLGKRRDEIADLGVEFDSMAQRIELLVNAQRRLLHDVSHELRSPLARLEVAIELAIKRQGDAIAPEMNRITREAQRLNVLVDELLLLARLENGIDTLQLARVDAMELIVAIADDAQFEARAKERDVQLVCDGSFVTEVNAEILYRAFENVIRNAVKYTKIGTVVTINVQTSLEAMVVIVTDHGPGLSDSMLETIFEPFRRFESDRDIDGFGLGLAIAKHALEAHGGNISVVRNNQLGLTFTMLLPRLRAATPDGSNQFL